MIHHLEVSTLLAALCCGLALSLPRSWGGLRHLILLLGILRFAAYTPWLSAAGAELARFVPQNRPPTPHLLHTTLHLLADPGPPSRSPAASFPALVRLKPALWWLWYGVAAYLLGRWLAGFLLPVRAVREATFWERELFLRILSRSHPQRKVELRIAEPNRVPGAQGWLRPRVLLPDGILNHLEDAELEPVIAHELAHLRRRDPLIAGLVRAIVSVFWFHPLLWWMERRMLTEREAACDAIVLDAGASPGDYVAALAKVCTAAFNGRISYAGVTGANLARRIEMIRSPLRKRGAPRLLLAAPVALTGFAAMIPIAQGVLLAQGAPADPLALALMLDRNGHRQEALAEYQKVIDQNPDNLVALNNAAYLLADSNRNLGLALVYAERAHLDAPNSADVDDTVGWVYLKRNMPEQATLAFRESVLRNPKNMDFRNHMAQALDRLANPPAWVRELRGLILTSDAASDARLRELLEMIGN